MKKPLFFFALLLSGAASAQNSAPASGNGAGAGTTATANPGQMICRSQRETGSMLARTRVCKTRAEWDAERRDNRQSLDRSQTNRPMNGN
jgi:hypothetical protein